MIDLGAMTREEKMLLKLAIDLQTEEETFSGHNTAWAELVDLIVDGRRGVKDFSDEELDRELAADDELANFADSAEALLWARKSSRIDFVRLDGTWEVASEEQQRAWDLEDANAAE